MRWAGNDARQRSVPLFQNVSRLVRRWPATAGQRAGGRKRSKRQGCCWHEAWGERGEAVRSVRHLGGLAIRRSLHAAPHLGTSHE
jgi:hypothetical protein